MKFTMKKHVYGFLYILYMYTICTYIYIKYLVLVCRSHGPEVPRVGVDQNLAESGPGEGRILPA